MKADIEARFEDAIESALLEGGWLAGPTSYSHQLGLDTAELDAFIKATQPKEFQQLANAHGGTETAQRELAKLVAAQIDDRGALDVLRHGVKDRGVTIRLAYFRPSHTLADGALDLYQANRLTVARQFRYSAAGSREVRRPGAVPQRDPRRDGRAEESRQGTDGRGREAPVPHRPRPKGTDLRPPYARALRRRSGPCVHHHPAGRGEDAVPAVQHGLGRTRPARWRWQPARRSAGGLPDVVPVGAGLAAGRMAGPDPAVPARGGPER